MGHISVLPHQHPTTSVTYKPLPWSERSKACWEPQHYGSKAQVGKESRLALWQLHCQYSCSTGGLLTPSNAISNLLAGKKESKCHHGQPKEPHEEQNKPLPKFLASKVLPGARRQVCSGLLTQNMAQAETEVPGSEAV